MKKFIANVLIFVIIVVSITCCINYVYIRRDHYDPERVNKFNAIPTDIMICNFGSSHGLFGFNYEDVEGVVCFNFGLSGQVLSYDKRLFDYYKDNISSGAVVFIPVSYFSLYGNDERMERSFLNKNKRYYQFLPSDLIKDYDLKTDIYVKFPSLSASVNLIKVLLFGSEDTNEEKWSTKKASNIDVQHDAEKACERHIFENKMDDDGNRILNNEEIDSLMYLVNVCYEKGCIPILVTTPFLKEYTDEIKKNEPDFFEDFYFQINKIVHETGVRYYDYGFDDRFINNYDWFMNSDHLNKEGARQFVDILMDEVILYGTDESLIE